MKLLRFSSRFLEMSLNDSLPNCLLGEGSSPMQGPSQIVAPGSGTGSQGQEVRGGAAAADAEAGGAAAAGAGGAAAGDREVQSLKASGAVCCVVVCFFPDFLFLVLLIHLAPVHSRHWDSMSAAGQPSRPISPVSVPVFLSTYCAMVSGQCVPRAKCVA